jgi:tellurite methyltransferase
VAALERSDGGDVNSTSSVDFFERQFRRQLLDHDFELNPFERLALPHLRGRVLDLGCGLGNLAVEAARRGCTVLALDASVTAIEHLRQVAAEQSLPLEAAQADLRQFDVDADFDTVVSIGLLMFFDCATARHALQALRAHVRPGGTAIVNVLVQGTTWTELFDADSHCLFARGDLVAAFAGWQLIDSACHEFTLADGRVKAFETVIARRPGATAAAL